MDPRMLIGIVVAPTLTVGFTAVLFAILHLSAVRRGGSILDNLGGRGWVIAIQVVFASSLFSGIVVNALAAPYNVPVDWTPALVYAPILGGLGAAMFLNAWRALVRSLPAPGSSVLQKG